MENLSEREEWKCSKLPNLCIKALEALKAELVALQAKYLFKQKKYNTVRAKVADIRTEHA